MLLPDGFIPLWTPPAERFVPGLWFVVRAGKLLVHESDGTPRLPQLAANGTLPVAVGGVRCIGTLSETPCFAAQAESDQVPADLALEPLRRLFDRLPDAQLAIAGRATQVVEFDRTHAHCGVCATPTRLTDAARARACPACGEVFYPRLAPAVMALVWRDTPGGRELLLARGTRFQTPIYSALAGFVEPSESIEECVRREVQEEVGIRVGELRYFGSESWPFPHSLMIGFLAEYRDGEIVCQPGEIVDAQWFSAEHLPQLPHRLSLARRLIAHALGEAASGPLPV